MLSVPVLVLDMIIFGWINEDVKGMKRLVLPREAGILIDERDYIFVMETHYDNPDGLQGNIDFSGVKVHYTNTMREHEAGSLLMGDILVSRFNQTVRNDFEYEFSCTSACTRKFSRPVNYYASFLHMHLTGKEIYNNRFSQNGTFVETMNKVSILLNIVHDSRDVKSRSHRLLTKFLHPRCSNLRLTIGVTASKTT